MVLKKSTIENWHQTEAGYEVTDSAELIKRSLRRLLEKRTYLVLLQKGYQSGNTVAVAWDERILQVDKPRDWPAGSSRVRVIFRDEAGVWNHFNAAVTQVSKDTIFLRAPQELFKLQRRAHYRVAVPSGTLATFTRKGQVYKKFNVQDISVGGISLCAGCGGSGSGAGAGAIGLEEEVSGIVIVFPGSKEGTKEGEPTSYALKVAKGCLVRRYTNAITHGDCMGIRFFATPSEEKELLYYVRQRELEIIRSGAIG